MLGELIIDRWGNRYDLNTGQRHLRVSTKTGEPEEWSFKKSGCNHLIACEHLVTWRCAYYDLQQHESVKLTGMDAGCSPTLIPAGGVLKLRHAPQTQSYDRHGTGARERRVKSRNSYRMTYAGLAAA